MQKDLFIDFEFKKLKETGISVETKEVVHVEKYVILDGQKFELDDLLNLLDELAPPCDIQITSKRMGEMLLKYGVVKTVGCGLSAAHVGPNYKEFYDMISNVK